MKTKPHAEQDNANIIVIIGILMLVMLLAALDQTIVSTALPTLVSELGGMEHISWVVTSYILATTIVTPIYGKLGDMLGRKLILQGAIILFLAGSVLCGLSQSMTELILFRAIQGLGGGGLIVTSMAVVGDIISPRERGRYQGYFGGVFGVATVIGPLLGGFFVEHLSWRWIFYVNLPLGAVALITLGIVLPRSKAQNRPAIDIIGITLLTLALVSIVLIASLGGHALAWRSPWLLAMAAVATIALPLFFIHETKAREPILPTSLFKNRIFAVCTAVAFIVGFALFGAVTFMPLYLQVVKGSSPSLAGMQLTPMMGGVLLTSILSGQIISRTGRYRFFPIVGTAIMTTGLGLLATLDAASPTWQASIFMLVLGLGLGMVMQVLILAVQNSVDYAELGVATSGVTLFRSVGGSVGVSIFGALFSAGIAQQFAGHLSPGQSIPTAADAAQLAALPAALRDIYLSAVAGALQPIFILACTVALLGFLLTWLLREIPLRDHAPWDMAADTLAMPRDANSLHELETIIANATRRENRWQAIQHISDRLQLHLPPDELWLFIQAGRENADHLNPEDADIAALARKLEQRQLLEKLPNHALQLSTKGRACYQNITNAYRKRLSEIVQQWSPEEHEEVRQMINQFARELISELPRSPVSSHN